MHDHIACDGAAPNLTVRKLTHGHSRAYNVNPELSDEHQVRPYHSGFCRG